MKWLALLFLFYQKIVEVFCFHCHMSLAPCTIEKEHNNFDNLKLVISFFD